MKSAGIDLSKTATGLVVLAENMKGKPFLIHNETISPPKKMTAPIDCYKHTITALMEALHLYKPDRIVVEGYSLNMKNASSVIPLVEIGGLLRFMMHIDGMEWYEPRASEVKKFLSGNGNTPKEKMILGVFQKWGFEAPDNNQADAYVLAAMGLCHGNKLFGANQAQRAMVWKLARRCN